MLDKRRQKHGDRGLEKGGWLDDGGEFWESGGKELGEDLGEGRWYYWADCVVGF